MKILHLLNKHSKRRQVVRCVVNSVDKYGQTYRLLDQYDKGDVTATKYLAEYRRLRRRLHNSRQVD